MNVRLTADPRRAAHVAKPPAPTDTTEGERFYRAMPRVGDVDPDSRKFLAVVATATPVSRRDSRGPFLEILDPAGLEFASDDDWPLLTDHRQSARETVGRASALKIDGQSVTATLRLGQADDIEPLFQRVREGTIRHVSAGYQVLAWRETVDPQTRQRTKTATRWRLLEVSLVPVPADPKAVIKRSAAVPLDIENRTALIDTLRSACNLPETWGEGLDDESVTDEAVREAARAEMLRRGAPRITIRRDNSDPAQIRTRAADALAFRMVGGELPEASREFVGMSLRELAADALQRTGVSTRGMSADDVFARSLGTSDFPLLVSNAMGKVAAQAYQAAESPLKALARQRTLPNFKESTSVRIGEMGRLEEMTEHGEFTHTSRAEAGETMSLRTFGRAINVSRKLLIDDDLGLLGDMTSAMGQAAAQTEAEAMVALLAGNPDMADGVPVFHASRGNLGTTLDHAMNTEGLSRARKAMRTVKGLDGKTIIDVRPRHLVVGPDLETEAERLLAAINPTTTQDVNPFVGKLSLVVESRLDGDAWYLLADPASVPCLQYGYLSSAQGVQIQRQEAWDTLGMKFRAWLDFGCGWLDWRGAFKAER
ncbi:phage major capsid protein [Frigidibacter sp. MR17.24]|uniref:phage major capsid protein n=1 Tax=Frigidibacter sp. MR17.24 TaxID=3127345 RepID=UPI0030131AA8